MPTLFRMLRVVCLAAMFLATPPAAEIRAESASDLRVLVAERIASIRQLRQTRRLSSWAFIAVILAIAYLPRGMMRT